MNLSNSRSHPSASLQRHTKTPMRRFDVSCGPGGENEMPWPFMRGALSPSSRTASAAAAKPRSVMPKMSGLMALELYARITSTPFTPGAAAGSAIMTTPACSTASNESSAYEIAFAPEHASTHWKHSEHTPHWRHLEDSEWT